MGDYRTAGQFKIERDQFQQYIPGGKNLFVNINGTKDLGGNALAAYFSTEQNKVGQFTFSGDAVIWHDDRGQFLKDKKDQNAWLVCVKNDFRLYINLRYYSDPSTGCNSHTVCEASLKEKLANNEQRFIFTTIKPQEVQPIS
jgi:hypothetical protein